MNIQVYTGKVFKCPAQAVVEASCVCKPGWGHRSFVNAAVAPSRSAAPKEPKKLWREWQDKIEGVRHHTVNDWPVRWALWFASKTVAVMAGPGQRVTSCDHCCCDEASAAPPSHECKHCKLYHDRNHSTNAGGKWKPCGHPAYLGTDHCEVCLSAAPPSEREAITEEIQNIQRQFESLGTVNNVTAENILRPAFERIVLAARAAVPQAAAQVDGKFSCDGNGLFNTVSGERIPADEPLFLLRARDHHALAAIHHYIGVCAADCNDLHLAALSETEHEFTRFTVEHPERMKEPGKTRHVRLRAAAVPAPATEWENRYRQLLWESHAGYTHRSYLYGDDGEMQCNHHDCLLDFKRAAIEEIDKHLWEMNLKRAAKQQAVAGATAPPKEGK